MNDVEVKRSQQGMELKFNKSDVKRQELEVEVLQRELEEKEQQMK